jgi:hypothetical protein
LLATCFCTNEEIAARLNCSSDTLTRRYAEPIKQGRDAAKASLRTYQFQMAKTNPAMAIWLGKQYLGQREPKIEIDVNRLDSEIDVELKRLAQLAAGSETSTSGEAEGETIN